MAQHAAPAGTAVRAEWLPNAQVPVSCGIVCDMVTSSAGIGDLLHEVLVCGDEQQVRFIRARHVSDGLLSAIADATHEYAMSMITDPGAGDGWFTFPGGILSWWAVEAGLSDEEQRRLHRFRSDVVRLLEEGDVALRTHPQSTPLLVRASGGTSSNLYWLRDEVVLALELYVKAGCLNGGSLPGKTSPLVAGLSSELQALPVHPQAMRPEDFRNIDGVALETGQPASCRAHGEARSWGQRSRAAAEGYGVLLRSRLGRL